jgi:hypothetical protein
MRVKIILSWFENFQKVIGLGLQLTVSLACLFFNSAGVGADQRHFSTHLEHIRRKH